jgi:hypothetical protein
MCIYVNSTYVSSRWISLDPVHVGRRSARVFFILKRNVIITDLLKSVCLLML